MESVGSYSIIALLISKRIWVTILTSVGLALLYSMRTCLTIAIVKMTDSIESNDSNTDYECKILNQSNHTGQYNWDQSLQSAVLSSFFYSYTIFMIPGGVLADKIGGKTTILCATFGSAIFTLITPLSVYLNVYVLIIVRVMEGMLEAPFYEGMMAILRKWCANFEVTAYIGISISGAFLGTIISQPVTGYLSSFNIMHGWPLAFYVFGVLGLIWCILWYFLVTEYPHENPYLSESEKDFIKTFAVKPSIVPQPIPWLRLFTYIPLYANCIGQLGLGLYIYIILSEMPTYLANALGVKITTNGILNALPFIMLYISLNLSGFLTDYLSKLFSSKRLVRSVMAVFGSAMPLIFNFLIESAGCNSLMVVLLVSASMLFLGAFFSQLGSNIVESFPLHTGIAYGIVNTAANIQGIVAPYFVELFTHDNIHNRMHWQHAFNTSSVILLISGILFAAFVRVTPPKWALVTDENQKVLDVA